MSVEDLKRQVLALPPSERAMLAQELWQSIDDEMPELDEQATVSEAQKRAEELISGAVVGRTREQVMQAARRAIRCD